MGRRRRHVWALGAVLSAASCSGGGQPAPSGAGGTTGSTTGGATGTGGGPAPGTGGAAGTGGAPAPEGRLDGGGSTSASDAAPGPSADAGPAAPAGDGGMPGVRFIARVDWSNPAAPRFAWSGSEVVARFTGSSVAVRLAGAATYFDVRIDGMLQPTLATSASKQEYPLAANLGPGPHEVSVYRRTEAREGITTFSGFVLPPGGVLLPPPPPSARRLEIVGDSTTCGYGDEGKSAGCPFTPATENYDVAYGPVAARAVGADLITVAWSARGMYRNFAGDMKDTLPVLYGRTLGDPSSPAWNPSSWIPDAVVVNLGSNDFQQGDPGQPFVTTYTAFVRKLRQYYPQALILCVVGPKLSGQQLDKARVDVKDLVTALNDPKVGFLELPQPQAGEGSGCGGHASIATHKHMGEVLAAELKTRLGW